MLKTKLRMCLISQKKHMIISLAQSVLFTVYALTHHKVLRKPIHQAHDPQSHVSF